MPVTPAAAGRGELLVGLPDGTALWTTTSGAGPPVVLLHGGPGLWDHLGGLAALLEHAHTVVRFDQRGCGRSAGRSGPFTVAQAVDDVDQLRRVLGVPRWAVVGHSWGAELAIRVAVAHPASTTSAVALAPVGAGDAFAAGYEAERGRRLGADLDRWRDLGGRARDDAEEREWCLLQWRADASPSGDPVAAAEEHWRSRPPGVQVNSQANRELWADRGREDLLAAVRGLSVPVLLVQGADDPRPVAAVDPVVAASASVQRLVLAGAGHAPWVERPDDVARATLAALAGRMARPG